MLRNVMLTDFFRRCHEKIFLEKSGDSPSLKRSRGEFINSNMELYYDP